MHVIKLKNSEVKKRGFIKPESKVVDFFGEQWCWDGQDGHVSEDKGEEGNGEKVMGRIHLWHEKL